MVSVYDNVSAPQSFIVTFSSLFSCPTNNLTVINSLLGLA